MPRCCAAAPVSFADLIDRVRSLYSVYDPVAGKYCVIYAMFLEIAGGVTFILFMIAFVVNEWRARRASASFRSGRAISIWRRSVRWSNSVSATRASPSANASSRRWKNSPDCRQTCEHERAPVTVEIDIDGALARRQTAQPSGLSSDGASAVYHRLEVPAGNHGIGVRLKDNARSAGFDYTLEDDVTLATAEILVIDFDSEQKRITLR